MAMDCLKDYMESNSVEADFSNISKSDLASILRKFYVCARSKTGNLYKRNSFNCIKFGIARFMKSLNGFDIVNDPEFAAANEAFKAQCVELKRQGKSRINHHSETEPEDLQKLYTSVAEQINTPKGLQRKVWIDIMLHLIRRGRENLRRMTKSTFAVDTDVAGRRFVH